MIVRGWLLGSDYDGPPDHVMENDARPLGAGLEWVARRTYDEFPEWEKIEVASGDCTVTVRRTLLEAEMVAKQFDPSQPTLSR